MRLRVADVEFNAVVKSSSTLTPEEEKLAASLTEVSQQKILATFWTFSLLVKVDGYIQSFRFSLPAWHQSMASKHPECYMQCLEKSRPKLGDIPASFERRQRL
eukprot:4259279-Pyramimonas_sp.AAC.1